MNKKIAPQILVLLVFSFNVLGQVVDSDAPDRLDPLIIHSDLDKQGVPHVRASGSHAKKSRLQLQERNTKKMSDLLGSEPGVEFTGGPRTSAELPQIRGLGSDRILVLDEGVRQSFQSGHNGRIFADMSAMENVEVVKGPWSSLYGSGAMGGVLSFRRTTASDIKERSGKNKGLELGFDAASADEQLAQRLTIFSAEHSGKYAVQPLFSYRHNKANDLTLGNGSRLRYSAAETQDFYTSLGLRIGSRQAVTIKMNRYQDRSIAPLNSNNVPSSATDIGDYKVVKQDAVIDYLRNSNNLEIRAKPFFRETQVRKVRPSDGRTDVQSVETLGVDTWINLTNKWSTEVTSLTTFGVEYFKDSNKGERNSGALSSFPNGSSEQYGIYLQPVLTMFKNLTLTPGMRYSSFKSSDSSGASASSSGEDISNKLYVSYEFMPEKVFFIGYGQSFNAPRLQDLYISGQHFPGNNFVANPNLRSEKANTVEIGSKNIFRFGEDDLATLDVTYFQTQATDFISREVNFVGGTTQFVNLDRVRLNGFEVAAHWQFDQWSTGVSHSQVRSRNEGSRAALSDTPADKWLLKVERLLSENVNLGTEFNINEAQNNVPSGTQKTTAFATQNIYARYTNRIVELNFRINNIYDQDYRRHGSFLREPGRDFRLSASYLF